MAEGGCLENSCSGKPGPGVQIPLSPPDILFLAGTFLDGAGRDARVAEGVRLESVCALIVHRGFESLSLRQNLPV